jgi:presenilin-like A22 family membrane protease
MKYKIHLFRKELFFFVLAHAVGIYVASRLLINSQPRFIRVDITPTDLLIFAGALLLIILLMTFFRTKKLFYRAFLILIIYLGTQTVFASFLSSLHSYIAAAALLGSLMVLRSLFLQNVAVSLAIAGIGGVIGWSFTPTTAIILLAAFSVYDIIAVYKTKHMVKMAKNMIDAGAIFGLVIVTKKPKDFMILGSGDILLPLILASTVAIYSIPGAVIVSTFAAAGLFVTHLLFSNQKRRKPMAALPPIATLSIIGYLVATLLL